VGGGGCADSSGECVGGWSRVVVSEVVFSEVITEVVVLIGEVSASCLSSGGGSDVDVASDLTAVGGDGDDGDDGGDGDSDNAANSADRSSQPSQLSVSTLCCDSSPGNGSSPIVAFANVARV
jgi:hypothetical protein